MNRFVKSAQMDVIGIDMFGFAAGTATRGTVIENFREKGDLCPVLTGTDMLENGNSHGASHENRYQKQNKTAF
jgi:hypothetical protein